MSDMDHAEWLNGPEPPECVECGEPTTRTDDAGIPIHAHCEDNRNEAAYERSQSRDFTSAAELSRRGYEALRDRRK